jgi:hypothetical protein
MRAAGRFENDELGRRQRGGERADQAEHEQEKPEHWGPSSAPSPYRLAKRQGRGKMAKAHALAARDAA